MTSEILWFVESPEYEYHEVILDDGTGPWIPTRDWIDLKATTRREAISLAVKRWLGERGSYCYERKGDGLSPYKGIVATSEPEAIAKAKASPPTTPPEWCDVCPEAHPIEAGSWVWSDTEDWGWRGSCETASSERTET